MVLARIGDINPGEAQRGEVWKREVEEQIQAHLGVCVCERESVCECVCVREREREEEVGSYRADPGAPWCDVCVCACVRVCVCVRERERERERVRE